MKNLVFVFCLLGSLVLGYGYFNTWWQFIPSTLLILGFTCLFFPGNWKKYLGIDFPLQEFFGAALLCCLFSLISYFVIQHSLSSEYTLGWNPDGWGFLLFVNNLFQSLNEELIFRALLINLLLYWGVKQWKIIVFPALFFSLLHWVFYRFNVSSENQGSLSFSALCSLFFFGLSVGLIFLKSKKVLIPWALHAAWNFNRFRIIKVEAPSERINEALTFNVIEGSLGVVVLSFVLLVICYFFYREHVLK